MILALLTSSSISLALLIFLFLNYTPFTLPDDEINGFPLPIPHSNSHATYSNFSFRYNQPSHPSYFISQGSRLLSSWLLLNSLHSPSQYKSNLLFSQNFISHWNPLFVLVTLLSFFLIINVNPFYFQNVFVLCYNM